MNSLKLAAVVTHVADARTCVLHPASSTHRQLSDKELVECGVSPDLIRFSVGIVLMILVLLVNLAINFVRNNVGGFNDE